MPDGVTIIYKLDEPSMGESSFKGRLPPLGGSPVTCFHAQQCVEKYLKAWLVQQEIDFPRTHDLEALAKQGLPSLPDLDALMDELRFLTSYAVEIRYPGTFAEPQDAETCWQTAVRARDLIRRHLEIEE